MMFDTEGLGAKVIYYFGSYTTLNNMFYNFKIIIVFHVNIFFYRYN